MDKIDKIMRQADKAGFGVSYGKFMAAQRTAEPETKAEAPKHPPRICPNCGKEFYRNTTTKMFCSMTCAALVRNEERRQKKRETRSEG